MAWSPHVCHSLSAVCINPFLSAQRSSCLASSLLRGRPYPAIKSSRERLHPARCRSRPGGRRIALSGGSYRVGLQHRWLRQSWPLPTSEQQHNQFMGSALGVVLPSILSTTPSSTLAINSCRYLRSIALRSSIGRSSQFSYLRK